MRYQVEERGEGETQGWAGGKLPLRSSLVMSIVFSSSVVYACTHTDIQTRTVHTYTVQ